MDNLDFLKTTQASAAKLPPHNTDAEQSALGSALIDKNALYQIAEVLAPSDFYIPAHETIFEAILELHSKHQPVDILTITNYLKEKDRLTEVGGSSYIADLTNHVTTAANAEHYAKIVKEKRVLRDLIQASAEITQNAFDSKIAIEELLDGIEQKILSISQKSLPHNFVHIRDELREAYERIEKLHAGEGRLRGIPTGFSGLDNVLSGLQKSDLVVIGARPSLGKTSLVLDIARHVALKEGLPVGLFSVEMSREQITDRFIATEARVPLWKLRTGRLKSDEDFQLIQSALDRLSQAKLFVDDSPSPNVMQMRSMARRLQVEHGLALIIVDYLQLILSRRGSDSMVQQVTEISRGLKALARELNVPVIAVSQLSRDIDKRDNRTPRLSDLRESGSIEQDADVVIFIHKKNRGRGDLAEEERGITTLTIAKHRNGPLGNVEVRFNSELVTFENIERRHTDEEAL